MSKDNRIKDITRKIRKNPNKNPKIENKGGKGRKIIRTTKIITRIIRMALKITKKSNFISNSLIQEGKTAKNTRVMPDFKFNKANQFIPLSKKSQ